MIIELRCSIENIFDEHNFKPLNMYAVCPVGVQARGLSIWIP
jgi:hypothetical protein